MCAKFVSNSEFLANAKTMNKLGSLEATLVRNFDRLTDLCRL